MHFSPYKPMSAPAPAPSQNLGELYLGLVIAGNVNNLIAGFIYIINACYKGREGSIDDILVADIWNQLLNSTAHMVYAAIIHNDVISLCCAVINFVLICIYGVVYWKYASSDQRKKVNVRLNSVIVIMILSFLATAILNIIPCFNKRISRRKVNGILYVVITSVCTFYGLISLLATAFCDGKIVPSVMQIMQIIFQIGSSILLLIFACKMGDLYIKITNIVGICYDIMSISIISIIFGCYNLCQTAQTTDIERGETSDRTPPSSLPQSQPEPDTPLQNMGTATGSVDDHMSGTDVLCCLTSSETQNKSLLLSPLPHSPGKEEGAASTSVNSTLFSVQNVKNETPTNLQYQTLATPTGSVDDRKSTSVSISSRASSETQNESAPGMESHNLDPTVSAPASVLSPLSHSPAKDKVVAPKSVDSTFSSILNMESETPINLQDQTLATPTGSADDRKSTTAAICSHNSYETQNKSAPDMKRHELDPSASARASPLPPLPHSPAKEEGAAPTSAYSTLSSIPNMESETPNNLQDQTLATPTDDRKSRTVAISSRAFTETQKELATGMKHHKLDPLASALASLVSPLPYSLEKETDAAPIMKSEIPTDLQDQTLAAPSASADDCKSAAAVNSSLASSETQNQSASDIKRPILDPSLHLPVSTVIARAPLVDGPIPYQGLHGPAEGGLLGAPKSFTLTASS